MFGTNETVSENLDKLFAREEGIYGSLSDLPLAWQKGHFRRAEILDSLDIGDVSKMVCLDFGCGSWGFANLYPKLHKCRFAYGMDISRVALDQSAALASESRPSYWEHCAFLRSDGMDLPLESESVDLVFAGEAIEHVRFPSRFLAECYRVMKPGGQLILTTPNREAIIYRTQDDIYGNWTEHFWLCNWPELRDSVSEFFSIRQGIGFNGAIYREMDKATNDEAAEIWSKLFYDRPDLATGIIIHAIKEQTGLNKSYQLTMIPHSAVEVRGPSQLLDVGLGLKGIMIDSPESQLRFHFSEYQSGIVVVMWSHLWSGRGAIQVGTNVVRRSFWAQDPGWRPLTFAASPAAGENMVTISADGAGEKRSLGTQVIFCEAFTYRV